MPSNIVLQGRCPPPQQVGTCGQPEIPEPGGVERVCVGHLVNALADIERWIQGVRTVLEEFPPDTCVCIEQPKIPTDICDRTDGERG